MRAAVYDRLLASPGGNLPTLIKICGLRRAEDIRYVNEARPDLAGFILSPGYRRSITEAEAGSLRRMLAPGILAVGVFVDAPREEIASFVTRGIIDIIQLHGRESTEEIRALQSLGVPVMKAMQASAYDPGCPADLILLDSGKGSGKTFDWDKVPAVIRHPWFLAGGIDADNCLEAIDRLHPTGLDFSSSVETDGLKDREKILHIAERIKNDEKR